MLHRMHTHPKKACHVAQPQRATCPEPRYREFPKIQPRVPLNLKCYKISPIFLIEFPNSLKFQNYRNYQNTPYLSLNRELTNFLWLISLRHHESINKLFKHINNHFKSNKARPITHIGHQWPELRKYPYKHKIGFTCTFNSQNMHIY